MILPDPMNILSIGTDRKIFEKGSIVRARMIEYGQLFDELHIVIFATSTTGYRSEQISSNVWIYSTKSWSRWSYIFDAIKIGKKILRSKNADWRITCQDPFETGLVGARLSKLFNLPLQIQIHTDFLSPYFIKHSFLNRIRTFIAARTLPKAGKIRVVSQRIKNSLVAFNYKLKSEPEILPIYVDAEKIKNTPISTDLKQKYPQFSHHILMASRLTPEKKICTALEAFAIALKKLPAIGLIIVGSGTDEVKIKEKINELGLSRSVIVEPWCNDMISLYKTATIFLSTSIYEGYGLTLVEATISGCPVISSDVGIIGSILHVPAIAVCMPTDVKCFAEKIFILCSDQKIIENMKNDAYQDVIKTCLSKQDYLSAYRDLL